MTEPERGHSGGQAEREAELDRPGRWSIDERARRAVRDVAVFAPAYAVPGVASLVTVPVLFLVLGPAEYGRWALLYAVAAGVPQVTTSWLESRVVRFGHRARRSSDRRRTLTAVAGSLVVSALLASVVLPAATQPEVGAAAFLTVGVTLYLLAIARLQSRMRFGSVSVAASVRSIAGAALGLLASAVTGQAWIAIVGLAVGYVIGEITGLAAGVGAIQRRFNRGAADEAEQVRIADSFLAPPVERAAYGAASGAIAVANYAHSVGDRFILSLVRPLQEVGVYTATYAMIDLFGRFMPSVVLGIVRPRIFRAWDAGRRADLPVVLLRLAAGLAWLVAATVTIGIFIAPLLPILPIVATLAAPIGFGFAAFMAASAVGLAYSAATRQGRLAGHAGLAAAANVGLNAWLVPSYGPIGAAFATGASYFVLLILNVAGLRRSVRGDRWTMALLASAFGTLALVVVGTSSGATWAGPGSIAALATGLPSALRLVADGRSGRW